MSNLEIMKIERETRDQADSSMWYHHRCLHLTASNFGMIAKRRPTTPIAKQVKILLYTGAMDSKAMRLGQSYKDDARQKYLQFLKVSNKHATITLSGQIADSQNQCLACSPDGLVSIFGTQDPQGLVEIKCPHLPS